MFQAKILSQKNKTKTCPHWATNRDSFCSRERLLKSSNGHCNSWGPNDVTHLLEFGSKRSRFRALLECERDHRQPRHRLHFASRRSRDPTKSVQKFCQNKSASKTRFPPSHKTSNNPHVRKRIALSLFLFHFFLRVGCPCLTALVRQRQRWEISSAGDLSAGEWGSIVMLAVIGVAA